MAGRDRHLLIAARGLRMFSYGFLSVILALYLSALGFPPIRVGAILTVALVGGALTTAGISLAADRWGRRRSLVLFAALMALSGFTFALTDNFLILLLAAAVGTISPSGQEVGPFLSLEQAALSQAGPRVEVGVYAWYNVVGSVSVALGGLIVAVVSTGLRSAGWGDLAAQRTLLWAFAATGGVLAGLYSFLSPAIEARPEPASGSRPGVLRESREAVARLAALFAVDALAGGLVIQSLVALWFHQRYGVGLGQLGPLFFGTNVLSALSFLVAAPLARRFGLLRTMVFTHLPSNVLLMLVPLMPSWPLAAAVLLARHALSQMDVPTRQAYAMVLVRPEERAAAAGISNSARTAASSVAPLLSSLAFQAASSGIPFFLSGGLKSAYDLALWITFRRVPLKEGNAER